MGRGRTNPRILLERGASILATTSAALLALAAAAQDVALRPEHIAEVKRLSRRVDLKSHPEPSWAPARVSDLLKVRDALRTLEKSSAELAWAEDLRVVLSEESLVFLREPGRDGLSLEVALGQAEIDARSARAEGIGFEIVIGDLRARVRSVSGDSALARARKSPDGETQILVYGGKAEIEAAGTHMELAAGMGCVLSKGAKPRPPEKLLASPIPLSPIPGSRLAHANPRFVWRGVEGAVSYTIEVCRDAACGELIDRVTGLTDTRWIADGLPLGDLHFRITPKSPAGLDGFPSQSVPFEVASLWRRPQTSPEN